MFANGTLTWTFGAATFGGGRLRSGRFLLLFLFDTTHQIAGSRLFPGDASDAVAPSIKAVLRV